MAGIFKRQNTNWNGSLASNQAAITAVSGNEQVLIGITQQFSVQFSQNLSRIYDVSNAGVQGSVPVFYVGGRAEGNATIARVVGPDSRGICSFYERFSDVCNPLDMQFTIGGPCAPAGETIFGAVTQVLLRRDPARQITYKLTGVVMQSMQLGVSANDMIPNENIQMIFADLECSKAT